nr:MAG TPA_asm: hypothetical protein [Caudoviricetes sp.]
MRGELKSDIFTGISRRLFSFCLYVILPLLF